MNLGCTVLSPKHVLIILNNFYYRINPEIPEYQLQSKMLESKVKLIFYATSGH